MIKKRNSIYDYESNNKEIQLTRLLDDNEDDDDDNDNVDNDDY